MSDQAQTDDQWDDEDDSDFVTCETCQGEGREMTCFDDICRGQGFCMHGDGYRTCPTCKGSGEVRA